MLRRFVVAAFAVSAFAGIAPAQACQDPADVNCYSEPHEMHCDFYVREWCGNVPDGGGRPICAFHPVCDDLHRILESITSAES